MLALAVVAVSTIWVSSPEPVASCELAPGVRESLTAMLPEMRVEVGDAAGADELLLRIEVAEGAVRVVLSDGGGAELLVRTLAAAGSCSELADSVALVVERYLTDLAWQPGGVTVPPPEPRRPPPPAVTRPTPPPPRSGAPIHADASARAIAAIGPAQGGAAAALVLGRRALRVGVEVGGMWPRDEDVVRDGGATIGQIELSSVHALGGAGLARGRTAAMVWAGGERVAAAAAGTAVFQRVDQAGWQSLLRADVGYGLPLTAWLSLRVTAGVEWRPRPIEIRVEGANEAHDSPAVRALVGAGVAFRFR